MIEKPATNKSEDAIDDTILAARCPPGWRRDPLTGQPVMPCLGKLLFRCAPDEVPTHTELHSQMNQLWDYASSLKPCWVNLLSAIISDARYHKKNGRDGLAQDTEKYLADCIDAALRSSGTVRIRRIVGGQYDEPRGRPPGAGPPDKPSAEEASRRWRQKAEEQDRRRREREAEAAARREQAAASADEDEDYETVRSRLVAQLKEIDR